MTGFGTLGSTTDPLALVPGSVDTLRADAQDLRARAAELESEAEGPVRRPVSAWTGEAADRAAERRTQLAAALGGVADVYRTAAIVLDAHAQVLGWAQAQAQVAIDLWAAGIDAAATAGQPTFLLRPRTIGPFGLTPGTAAVVEVDPGASLRRRAEAVLATAKREVTLSQSAAAQVLDQFSEGLPDGRFHFEEFLAGIGDWLTGLAGLVWKFNTIRAIVDADAMIGDAQEMGQGVWDTGAYLIANPGETVPVLFDTQTMHDNPGRWWGRLAPDIALTAAGGVGVLTKTGAVARVGDNLSDLASRVRAIDWADDTGAISLEAWLRREPIDLTDGTQLLAATAEEQAAAAARINALPEGPLLSRAEAAIYQSSVYGPTERLVPLPNNTIASVDGITSAYGTVLGDAKLVLNPTSSIYIPESVSSSFAHVSVREMDRAILRLAEITDAFAPGRPIEIVTNDLASAAAWETRMRALGVTGYVRLHP